MQVTGGRSGTNCSSPALDVLLREWRRRALLTQEQLAERAGLNVRTIRRLESAELRRPRSASLRMLAAALGLDLHEKSVLAAAARDIPVEQGNGDRNGSHADVVDGGSQGPEIPVPRQLPPIASHFVGRRKELGALDAILGVEEPGVVPKAKVIAIVGGAGVGKTALAVQWGWTVANAFPDGSLYVNLRGFGTLSPAEPAGVLNTILRGMNVPPEKIPRDLGAASALYRTHTAGRRLLLLLDNALDAEQVRPLLPADGCVAIITSRDQMRGLMVRDATARISLSPLERSESMALLRRITRLPALSVDDSAVGRLIDLCDNSPLALRIIGERIARQAGRALSDIVDEIVGSDVRLEAFNSGDDACTDLRTVLSWSFKNLDDDSARMLRLVGGLYPGSDLGIEAASALSGLSIREAREQLDRLVSKNLVEQRGLDRYSLHDLIRAYAAEDSRRCDPYADRMAAIKRLLAWFLHCLYTADTAFAPDRVRAPMIEPTEFGSPAAPVGFSDLHGALRWCEIEYQTLTALPTWAYLNNEPLVACQIAYLLETFLAHYKHYHDMLDSHKFVMKAVREVNDLRLEGHLLSAMGNTYGELLRFDDEEHHHKQALRAFRACGDRVGQAKVLGNMAMAAIERKNYRIGLTRGTKALARATEIGYERGRAHILDTLGEAHFGLGDFPSAIKCWREALEINKRAGARFAHTTNLTNLGRAYAASGDHPTAIEHHQQSIAISRDIGSNRSEAAALLNLGSAYHAAGDPTAADTAWQQASALYSKLGDAKAQQARDQIGRFDQPPR